MKTRKAFVMSVNVGAREEYEKRHNPIWPELEKVLEDHGVSNCSIFLHPETCQLFGHAEIESEEQWAFIASTEVCQKWNVTNAGSTVPISGVISGTGSRGLIKSVNSNLPLPGANTHTGRTTIRGTCSLSKAGASTTIVTAANTYSGGAQNGVGQSRARICKDRGKGLPADEGQGGMRPTHQLLARNLAGLRARRGRGRGMIYCLLRFAPMGLPLRLLAWSAAMPNPRKRAAREPSHAGIWRRHLANPSVAVVVTVRHTVTPDGGFGGILPTP